MKLNRRRILAKLKAKVIIEERKPMGEPASQFHLDPRIISIWKLEVIEKSSTIYEVLLSEKDARTEIYFFIPEYPNLTVGCRFDN